VFVLLIKLTEVINDATHQNYAVPAFNVFGYEDAKAVIEAAE
jgi:fructose-bisphosphate aldolase class II